MGECKITLTYAMMTKPRLTIGSTTYELDLGLIERTMLGWEDHGIFTFVLRLNFGASEQGAGTLALGSQQGINPVALPLIVAVMKVVGVDEWEHLKGKRVYALRPHPGDFIRGLANGIHPEANYLVFERFINEFGR